MVEEDSDDEKAEAPKVAVACCDSGSKSLLVEGNMNKN